jgi:exonuclease SbcD
MIKFVHTADIHFGVENYGKLDPKTGIHSRLLDFVNALNFCIDHAIKEKVDFFLFSGDAYKTPHPTQTQQKLLLECFLRLYKAKIPAIIVVGNHDHPLSFGKVNALDLFGQLPLDGFYVVDEPRHIALETAHGPVNIIGIPWPTRNTVSISEKHAHKSAIEITQYISRGVAHIIDNFAKQLDPQIPAVLAGHLTVSTEFFPDLKNGQFTAPIRCCSPRNLQSHHLIM